MDNVMALDEKFLYFEEAYRMFDLADSNGIYLWDIVRFEIYINLMWDYKNVDLIRKASPNSLKLISQKLKSIIYSRINRKKTENFFFLASRNRLNGKLFDQNSYSVAVLFDPNKTFFFESNITDGQFIYNDFIFNYSQLFHRRYFKSKLNFDFNIIINRVVDFFGRCPLDETELKILVHNFYSDFNFFKRLFKRKSIDRVFITQNGQQKGLFAAAASLNIPSYEFQHGIVDKGHLIYNYPKITYYNRQLYLPKCIFSFSDFWFKEVFIPFVKIIDIGNDFFCKQIRVKASSKPAISVISSDVFGPFLRSFLLSALDTNVLKDYDIYFKLHPNQFSDKNSYKSDFKPYPQVTVISEEEDVYGVLEKSDVVLTIQSTAVYEALQAGRRVILLAESTFNRHEHIFSHPNLHIIKNVTDLVRVLKIPAINNVDTSYFSPFLFERFKLAIE